MSDRCVKATAAVLLAACSAYPQGMAPEVLLLSRIKSHLRKELANIPNYTCVETVSRFRRDPKAFPRSQKSLAKLDTIQLEIVYANGREWYGSPGAGHLGTDNPVAFIGGGLMGTGAFAISMHDVIEGGIFTYRGPELLEGRQAIRYDYRVPASSEPLSVSVHGGFGVTGEEGSIWVNPQNLDLLRAEYRAAEVPPYVPVQELSLLVNYARMRVASEDALLAQDSELKMIDGDGVESHNQMGFTHCHAYSANSEISFDGKPPEESAAGLPRVSGKPVSERAVPPFLEVTILLATPVSDRDSVGSLIEGKVSGGVIHKGKLIVPDGSVVRGRIRAVDRYPELDAFAVGLEFAEVDVRGESLAFYADLLRLDKDPRIERAISRPTLIRGVNGIRPADRLLTQPDLPGVASFFVKATEFTLPKGFRMVWRTRGLIRGGM
jgi:hypothetical protein